MFDVMGLAGARAVFLKALPEVLELTIVCGFEEMLPLFFLVVFLLTVPFVVLFFDFDPLDPAPFLRFGESPLFVDGIFFLFVPPGVVTMVIAGAAVTIGCGGEMTSPGERLVEDTTLAAAAAVELLSEGCTVGATHREEESSLPFSRSAVERLLKDVDGRNAPNPSSISPSFFPPSA